MTKSLTTEETDTGDFIIFWGLTRIARIEAVVTVDGKVTHWRGQHYPSLQWTGVYDDVDFLELTERLLAAHLVGVYIIR